MYSHNIGPLCNDHLDGTWEQSVLKRRTEMLLESVVGILTVSILTVIQEQGKQSEKIERVLLQQENKRSVTSVRKQKYNCLTLGFTVWFNKACL